MEIVEFIATLDKMHFSLSVEKDKLLLQGDKKKLSAEELQAIKNNHFVINYIKQHKQDLIAHLTNGAKNFLPDKKAKNISSIYHLSGLQQGMLFHGLYDTGALAYTNQFSCDFINLDSQIFLSTWNALLKHHTILRSAFYYDAFSVPVQCVNEEITLPAEILDFRQMAGTEQQQALMDYEEADHAKGFDFKTAPLMRVGLMQLSNERFRMLWTFHHILFDGWSLPVLMEEFLTTYDLLASGKEIAFKKEDRYEDYIRYIERLDKEQEESYWRNYLKNLDQATLLPFINKTTKRTKGVGSYKIVSLQLSDAISAKAVEFAQRNRITVNTIMQGVWSFLLHKYTGSKNVVFGVIVSGRPDDLLGVELRVGLYINTLPLLSNIEGKQNVVTWLQGLQGEQVASRQYQYTPLLKMQEWTEVQGNLFDSVLVFENYPVGKLLSKGKWGLEVENLKMHEHNNYPLSIEIGSSENIRISFNYNTALLDEVYVKGIRDQFEQVVLQIIGNDAAMLTELTLLTPQSEQLLLEKFIGNKSDYPKSKSIVALFEEQAVSTPENIAVRFEDEQLTYRELNERSNQLAHYIKSKGVSDETLVPICIERSTELIIGILAILKAGAAYVPIDPGYPLKRINFMLQDIGAKMMLSNKDSRTKLFLEGDIDIVEIDTDWSYISELSFTNLQVDVKTGQLAYVIYTSGSTGTPKGVLVTHRNVVSLVKGIDYVSLTSDDILLSTGSPSFDAATFEYWGMLLNGGQLILCAENKLLNSNFLKEKIGHWAVTKMWFTSSWFNQLVETDITVFNSLKTILVGGEKLSEKHIEKVLLTYPNLEIINGYGPTENTTFSLTYNISGNDIDLIPIGRPLNNRSAYIVDEVGRLMPTGVSGEIWLGGEGISKGYLNQPELTGQKFIKNLFNKDDGSRLYKTGDLGRLLPDGNIEYLGRIDEQVKIRGYRIELGEIENVLLQSGLISQAVVLANEDANGNKRLVGYVVTEEDFDRQSISNYLIGKLPEYMVPALWVHLESLPLTPNGKIDKKALPDPEIGEQLSNQYTAPRNKIEEQIAEIWQELLEVDRIGIHDDFFELGGHSLLAIRLISALRRKLEIELAINVVFEYPTIAQLSDILQQQTPQLLTPSIKVQPRSANIPLSFSQERLWFLDRLEGSVQYHVPLILRLKGILDMDALTFAIQNIVDRHEVLRTVFREKKGQVYQVIKEKKKIPLEVFTFREDDQENVHRFLQNLISKPFDLSEDNMLRASVVELNDKEHLLVVTLHHIASDAWSMPIMFKEIAELYTSYVEGRADRLVPLPIQYADYAIWQRNFLDENVLGRKLKYWKDKLEGIETLNLPTDYTRPLLKSSAGAWTSFNIDNTVAKQLKSLSNEQGTTLFITLLAAFKVLLHRYSGQEDICVGSPIANRGQQEVEGLIGFFLNTLAFRSEVKPGSSFIDLLQQVRATALEAYEHQEVPFEKVVDAVVKERDLSRNPLFQVMFVLLNASKNAAIKVGDLQLFWEEPDRNTSQFDLNFSLTETSEGLKGVVEYCTDLYEESTIERMITHFNELLHSIVKSPNQKIGELAILPLAEENLLLNGFNDTAAEYPKDKRIIELFEDQVRKTPQAIAVLFEEDQLSYKELNDKANRLAHYLQHRGVIQETLVPICIERGIGMITGVLAILKAGGVYVPIDPEYPAERINYMLEDTGATIIVSSKESSTKLSAREGMEVIETDTEKEAIQNMPLDNLSINASTNNLVYMLYTSGSTGRPKGVKMPDSGMVNLLSWQKDQFANKSRKVLQFASLNFDVSFQEIFSTLCFGSTLCLISGERRRDVAEVVKDIERYSLTHLFIPYIVFKTLVEYTASQNIQTDSLEEIIVAGEQLKLTEDIETFVKQSGVKLVNQYGPTEAHVVSSYTVDINHYTLLPPIGKPVSNTRLYILAGNKELVPVGVAGELYIGGVQVAMGYLNQEALTEEKFIPDPFSKEEGARLYKTGDLARWLADGNLEYLGRMDDQVKIRGFRIELGEVESVLQQSEMVRQAVVLAKEDIHGNKRLVTYIVSEGVFNREALIEYAKSRLPDYMVPALWVEMDSLPVTRNGKIDKRALPEPDGTHLAGNEYTAPRNSTEVQLAEIWQQLLGVKRIGVNDNFFQAGGHSLLATRIVSAIRLKLNVELSIRDLFFYPTIAELGNYVLTLQTGSLLPAIIKAQRPQNIPLSFSQERLWFTDKLEGSVEYHISSGLRLKGLLSFEALEYTLQSIINRHEVLRTVFYEYEGMPYQSVKEKGGYKITLIDGTSYKEDHDGLKKLIQELVRKPYDLRKDFMLRSFLIRLSDREHILLITLHHIAADAWSMPIVVQEVLALYKSFPAETQALLPALDLQYADYAIWQRNYLKGKDFDKKLNYWKQKLMGVPSLQLPTDHIRPIIRSSRGASIKFSIDKELSAKINELSQQHDSSLYMTLLAAFNVLLHRYSGQEDICVGASIANRTQHEIEGLVGFFVNTLAFRNQVDSNSTFLALLKQVRITALEAYEHQEIPFEKVVEAVLNERDAGRTPIFQVMLVLLNTAEIPILKLNELYISGEPLTSNVSKFDLTLFFTETSEGLIGSIDYSTDLYNEGFILRMLSHFKVLLGSIAQDPLQKIGLLQLLAQEEKQKLLTGLNDSNVHYPKDKNIAGLFEEQVMRTPDAIALVFEKEQLTYRELNERANQLAHYLISKGVKEGTLVPMCIDRSFAMIVAVIGILKAGGAYVPIDTDFPSERIAYMLDDCKATIAITSDGSRSKIENASEHIDIIEVDDLMVQMQSTDNPSSPVKANHLAYVIYTSGSTGNPKGVMIEHRNLVDYVFGLEDKIQVSQCNSYALVSTIATDLGNTVIYSSLVFGGALHLFTKEAVSNIEYVHEYFNVHDIDCLKIVPSHWKALCTDESLLLPKKLLIFGGEALQAQTIDAIKLLMNDCKIINHYGPSETTIGKLLHPVNFHVDYNNTIPIGKPFSNTRVYILSKDLQLCPEGVPGQLYIAGNGVARGYLNNDELTRTKFVRNPFDGDSVSLMYATGDVVKYNTKGDIEFIGRVDDQVKIRGFRVELGEIESILQQCELVSQAVVIAREDKQGNKKLVGYIVPAEGNFEKEAILLYLREKLPAYMIPSTLVELESLPLTANGKIDRKALPDPHAEEALINFYVAPTNETETRLAEIWQVILEVERIGVHDDFFELGGHSLLAVRLVSAIRKSFEVEIPISHIFDYPTVAQLATQLESSSEITMLPPIFPLQPRPDFIPLSFSQERLWFIDQLEGSIQYHVPAVLQLSGKLNIEALAHSLKEIVNRHEILRTVFIEREGQAFQLIKEKDRCQLNIIDEFKFLDDDDALQRYIQQVINEPFDLSNDDSMRAHLITLKEDKYVLVVTLHHIASDGWSRSILVKEVAELYKAYEQGKDAQLAPLNVQYADYALWQRRYLSGEVLDAKMRYWQQKLENVTILQLPTDYQRPGVQSNRGAIESFNINNILSEQLRQLSKKHDATLFMTMLAAFKVLLHRYSGQQNICVGTPIAGRQQQELELLIGFFVNTLALNSEIIGDNSFIEVLQQVRSTALEAYKHQEVPFEKVVEAVVTERDMSRSPLFQVMFVMRNTPDVPELHLGEVTLSAQGYEHTTTMFDITIYITETSEGLDGAIEYSTDLYSEQSIVTMISHFKELLKSIVRFSDKKIALLSMLSKAEEQQLLIEFNNTEADYPKETSLVDLFEKQVERTPAATAVIFEEDQLSYDDLNKRANQLAHYLKDKGVGKETIVPICIERGLEMIIGILGILKAGGAFVPIDPEYPIERIRYMISDSKASTLISSKESSSKLEGETNIQVINLDKERFSISQQPTINLPAIVQPHHLAYVIYTSGSTGNPKGVMIEHCSLINLLESITIDVQFTSSSSFLSVTTFSFDICYLEFFVPLINGGKLIVVPREVSMDGFRLAKSIAQYRPTHMQGTPSTWQLLLDSQWENEEQIKILIGGEAVKETLKDELTSMGTVFNLYGPTETTIWSAIKKLEAGEKVLIGKPIANTTIYILNDQQQLCSPKVAGEICIGGDGLARGYLNRPQLTDEKFIANPFREGDRLYRTGDLGRWLPDGNIECLGRIDDQVKIRGYRIELGEIETILQHNEIVHQSVVLAKEEKSGEKRLLSYYIPHWEIVKEKEKELYQNQVLTWKEVYEIEYSKSTEAISDEEFDINIWKDSFTGEQIPEEQMREWLNDIVEVIFQQKPQNVLEIGSGTGLIFYQLAGKIKKYIGTDFSTSSINQISQRISKGVRDYGPTSLRVCAAHEVSLKDDEQVDTIILNSIVQYFPGEEYVNEVVQKSISLLEGKGRVVIGDVRDNRLLELFKARLQMKILQPSVNVRELNWLMEQEFLKEEELCFSPEYFHHLQTLYPEITHVEIKWKKGSYLNELTLYRYNVILHIGIHSDVMEPTWQSWTNENAHLSIINQLEDGANMVAIKDAPNPRLWKEKLINKALLEKAVTTIGQLIQISEREDEETLQIRQVLNVAEINGYRCSLLMDTNPFIVNVLLEKNPSPAFIRQPFSITTINDKVTYTNIPLFTDINILLQKELRTFVKDRLPDYMVPNEFVALRHLPLTNNGKIDRKFLNERETKGVVNKINYKAPRTPTEQVIVNIWQELLGLDRVGVYDNFFELGGHSLLATRTVSAIRKKLEVELSIKDLFVNATVVELAAHINSQKTGLLLPSIIPLQPRPYHLPLSFSQERLLFIHRLEGSVQYHLPSVLKLNGRLNIDALKSALKTIVNRHEVLRTVFTEMDGQPYQLIKDEEGFDLVVSDNRQYNHDVQAVQFYIETLIRQPFDLSKDYMLRANLVTLNEEENILVVTMHHIASDGWSMPIILKEVASLYSAFEEGRQAQLPVLQIQYADFAIWQRTYFNGELFDKKLDYWKKKLQGLEPLQLPTDYPRPAVQSTAGATTSFNINKQLTDKLYELSHQHDTTLFMTLLGIFKVLLSKYSGNEDICVGCPIANRTIQEVEDLIGFFVNMIALRSNVSSDISFTDLLQQIRITTLEAYEHQEIPFEKVVEAVVKERNMSRSPLFQVLFAMQNQIETQQLGFAGIQLSAKAFKHTSAKFDITFNISETPDGLYGSVEYRTALYNEKTIKLFLRHFSHLLQEVVNNPKKKIGELQILAPSEKNQLLVDFNNTEVAYPANKTLADLFEEQVIKTPRAIAVIYEGEELSYEELNRKANQLAHYLRSKGVKAGSIVPICLERSLFMIISILGVLKAGGAYVPIDPEYPADRVQYMIKDTNASLVISTTTSASLLPTTEKVEVIVLDSDWKVINMQSFTQLQPAILPTHLAYIIYTSGSTGKPKGAMNEHRGTVNRLQWAQDYFKLTAEDVVLQKTTFSFDVSVWELLWPLVAGAKLVFAKPGGQKDNEYLKKIIENEGITMLHFVPSMLGIFLADLQEEECKSLRNVLCSGEALKPSQVNLFKEKLPAVRLHNLYGPTEAAIDVSCWSVPETGEEIKVVPIGKPVANTQLYIVDAHNRPVPVGIAGELHIGGVQVGRGYWNRKELTAEKFIHDPFSTRQGARLYKTGDLCRWLADGNIEYLGRIDDQVKIRGFRIELGEIESELMQSGLVSSTVVVAKENVLGNRWLVGYVVSKEAVDTQALSKYLYGKLPEYMVPALWVQLDSLPLTPNGKVDRKALPDTDGLTQLKKEYVAPRNELETALTELWQELLGVESVGIHDNFFELGGHSLMIMRMVSHIKKKFSFVIPIAVLFQFSSIADLSNYLEWQKNENLNENEKEEDTTLYEVINI